MDVVADIDKLVGKRGRSAFFTELARHEIARLAGELKGDWKRKGQTLSARDVAVGAGALSNGLSLLTTTETRFHAGIAAFPVFSNTPPDQ